MSQNVWQDIALVTETILDMCGDVFSVYTCCEWMAVILIILIVKRVLKTFNII